MKLPWLKFYTTDWECDAIAGCSLAAQGLWLRMICIAQRSERYGYLVQNGLPIPPESIARRCGCTLEQYESLLTELLRAGVPSLDNGVIYSRRMVKDEDVRNKNKVRKSRSRACHTNVTGQKLEVKKLEVRSQKLEEVKNNTVAPAALLSLATPPDEVLPKKANPIPAAPGIVPVELWLRFVKMRASIRKPLGEHAGELVRRELQRFADDGEDPIAILEKSIRNNWQDLFSLKKENPNGQRKSKPDTSEVVQSFLGHMGKTKPN